MFMSSHAIRHQQLTCDVLVAGGGPAGVAAALAASRSGARVVLCQDRPVLGGNASSEVRMHIVGADCSGGRGAELATEAREGGIIEEIRLEACVRNPQRSPSIFDLIFYEKCRAEPNLTLLLNTAVTAACVQNGRIQEVTAERQSTEDRFTITAHVFIDCTGDGRLGVEAGASFREGREAREEYGESLAPPAADHLRLGSTLMFQARRHAHPVPFTPPGWARRFSEEDLRLRPHATAELDRGLEYGYWWVEWGGCLDTIRDNERIRDELLAIVLGVWDHIKNGGDHGAANWALEWFGFLPGKRESRRFLGLHVLSESDVMQSVPMPDAIAYGGWPIDTHPPEGVDAPHLAPCQQHPVPFLYDIPLRACVSRDVPNLMFAGRNISATHVAFASTRVMATCASIGQGVGTAAAFAVRHKKHPAELLDSPSDLHQIQQQLLRDDVYLIGKRNEDSDDLARQATITATSEQAGGGASLLVSGQTRSVHGPRGVPPERAFPGAHRWMSDPADEFPVSVELQWPRPIVARSVRLIFDTGLHRVLTFSLADAYTAQMIWGQPQPETVREYRIELFLGTEGRAVAAVAANYQRLRVHPLDQQPFDRLRLTITATNGRDHARVCEIRVES
jgi:glycine/D-amino acid oxidase-like deaminating enzyme